VRRAHTEPLSDLLFTREALFTICYTGQVRRTSPPPWQTFNDRGVPACVRTVCAWTRMHHSHARVSCGLLCHALAISMPCACACTVCSMRAQIRCWRRPPLQQAPAALEQPAAAAAAAAPSPAPVNLALPPHLPAPPAPPPRQGLPQVPLQPPPLAAPSFPPPVDDGISDAAP